MQACCRLFLLALLAVFVRPAVAAEADFATPFPDKRQVAVHLWTPDGGETLEYLVILLPGFNGDWRAQANDPAWRAFGCFLTGDTGGAYARASLWSGKALLHAIDVVAEQAGHPELGRAPLLLWGFSAGGQFDFNFAAWQPQRVAAFLVNKGAYYDPANSSGIDRVPGLFAVGGNDTALRHDNITRLFAEGRRHNAPWSLAVEPGRGHEVGGTEELGRAFFAAILARRAGTAPDAPWGGVLADHTISPLDAVPGAVKPADLAWLPDETFAHAWQAAVAGSAASSPATTAPAEEEPPQP